MLVTGKGGVGKSTIATALALAAARCGSKPLLVEAGARASLRALIDVPMGAAPVDLGDGVHGMSLAGGAALSAFATDVLRSRRLANMLLGHRAIAPLLRALPAVAEVAALHVLERQSAFAPLVVDLEATGHARMWFELHDTLAPVMKRGPIAELLERSRSDLGDPSRTALVVVTRPEPLAVSEALELCDDLRRRAGVQPRALVVNATTTAPAIGDHELDALRRRARELGERALVLDLEALTRRCEAAAREREAAAPLWDTGLPIVWLPRHQTTDRSTMTAMGLHLAEATFATSDPPQAREAVGWT